MESSLMCGFTNKQFLNNTTLQNWVVLDSILLYSTYIFEWIYCLKLCIVYLRKGRHLIRFIYYKILTGALSHLPVAISANGNTVSNYAECI